MRLTITATAKNGETVRIPLKAGTTRQQAQATRQTVKQSGGRDIKVEQS
jgi:hypothetical protein